MIKPINISAVNTTNKVFLECEKCGWKAILTMTNYHINTDDNSEIKSLDYECMKCGAKL